ncbi:hypothetical protein ACFFX0_26680 [Citricoccus parietis]|uniref:Uncharacterized protein n=1 Tax=Citricoccus parietis TaxID=592307 RepID=A0ABV5G6K4_9MICC
MVADDLPGDPHAQPLGQVMGPAGVLGSDDVRGRQQVLQPLGGVGQVPDRCGRQHDLTGGVAEPVLGGLCRGHPLMLEVCPRTESPSG